MGPVFQFATEEREENSPLKNRRLSAGYSLLKKFIKALLVLGLIIEPTNAQSLVFVGDGGNPADMNGKGGIGYSYWIGKYEITISEYTTFLNSAAKTDNYALWYGSVMDIQRTGVSGNYQYTSGANGSTPVTWVNWFDAARYVNWMHNGASINADTENGAYTLNGATSGLVTKNSGAKYWLPNFDEWYKAAFYDPNKNTSGGYWSYATKSDSVNSSQANYQSSGPSVVGAFGITSAYGTYDQSGNVAEWISPDSISSTKFVGGGWNTNESYLNKDANASSENGGYTDGGIGFRIASSVPEPSALSLLAVGLGGLAIMRRRRS